MFLILGESRAEFYEKEPNWTSFFFSCHPFEDKESDVNTNIVLLVLIWFLTSYHKTHIRVETPKVVKTFLV